MPTYIKLAKQSQIHPDFTRISEREGIEIHRILDEIASGRLVIVPGIRDTKPVALGRIVCSKVLCNIGTSSVSPDIDLEIEKAKIAIEHGAKIVCDQSVGRNVGENRKKLIGNISVPIAAVPLYQNVDDSLKNRGEPLAFTEEEVLTVFEEQISQGVTMPGFHSMSFEIVEMLKSNERLMPLVSRGAGLMYEWIKKNHKENPYFDMFDDVLKIVGKNNVPLTFVSSLRSGTVVDGYDFAQKAEWEILKTYVSKAKKANVSVMVDGLGHMSMDEIGPAVKKFKKICGEVPLGVLGPAVTDRALGHEHVANAIGTAVAVWNGANYCNACYPTEHLGLPEIQDIPPGIGAAVIATYAGDLARDELKERLLEKERLMSEARQKNRWGAMLHNAIEKVEALKTFERVGRKNKDGSSCSICGELCPFVVTGKVKPED